MSAGGLARDEGSSFADIQWRNSLSLSPFWSGDCAKGSRKRRSTRQRDGKHEAINHSLGEYVRDGVSTNGIEAVWAVLKRGIYGTFHHVSEKHLDRYVREFSFRLNEGNVERHTLQRLQSFVDGTAGKRLTYKRLIA